MGAAEADEGRVLVARFDGGAEGGGRGADGEEPGRGEPPGERPEDGGGVCGGVGVGDCVGVCAGVGVGVCVCVCVCTGVGACVDAITTSTSCSGATTTSRVVDASPASIVT